MSSALDQSKVKRYEPGIFNSLVGHPDPDAEIVRIRERAVDASPEWQEAVEQAIARFEARKVGKA